MNTDWPALKEDHDLTPEEQAVREKLKAALPTLEEAAAAFGIDEEALRSMGFTMDPLRDFSQTR